MHLAVAIVKYLPTVLCGLLVVAWVITLFVEKCEVVNLGPQRKRFKCSLERSAVNFVAYDDKGTNVWSHTVYASKGDSRLMGGLYLAYTDSLVLSRDNGPQLRRILKVAVPFAIALLCMVPIAVGCLSRFRFPLWSYFAYTALIAAELAYYLR